MKCRTLSNKSRGQSFIEFALTLPLLIAIFMAVIELAFISWNYLVLLDSSNQGARLGSKGIVQYDNNDVYTLVTQNLSQNFLNNSSLLDVIIVRATLNGGASISNYTVTNMKGTATATKITQALLTSRLRAGDPGGKLIAVEVVYNYRLAFNYPTFGFFSNPFPISSYTIQYVMR